MLDPALPCHRWPRRLLEHQHRCPAGTGPASRKVPHNAQRLAALRSPAPLHHMHTGQRRQGCGLVTLAGAAGSPLLHPPQQHTQALHAELTADLQSVSQLSPVSERLQAAQDGAHCVHVLRAPRVILEERGPGEGGWVLPDLISELASPGSASSGQRHCVVNTGHGTSAGGGGILRPRCCCPTAGTSLAPVCCPGAA